MFDFTFISNLQFHLHFFDIATETNMYETKSRRIVKGIDVGDIANLQDLRKKL